MRRALRVAAVLLGAAAPALAHGPTVRVAWAGVQPPALTVEAGATVHFHNANSGAGACTLVADDGAFRSPPLARGEGWHHTFATAGRFAFHVEEYPSARGEVVVVEPH
jgi:plastocyanin